MYKIDRMGGGVQKSDTRKLPPPPMFLNFDQADIISLVKDLFSGRELFILWSLEIGWRGRGGGGGSSPVILLVILFCPGCLHIAEVENM